MNPPLQHWRGQRVWLIGASSGIGAALARHLLAQGAYVILSARNVEQLTSVAAGHPAARILPLDVCSREDWQQAARTLSAEHSPDMLIYCAADYQPEHSWQVNPERAAHTLDVNLNGVYRALSLLLNDWRARRHGRIVLVASVAGYFGLPGAPVYGPGKAALINLAELLYVELHTQGLSVQLVNPGFVATRLTARNRFSMPGLQTPEQAAAHIEAGLRRGSFEIHFPRHFTLLLKCLRTLPFRWRARLLQRFASS
ncbi:SDR family oxidoreductase [Paludibacterium sp. B53371]|uniref:SDR family NAD(P)-dependent oxidoreductase n=1 Tax=Paludibacterium sp. B53371 TaxID=2806263 RepID=UPI00207B5EC1|nr:SDR family NAD(P)-dependent oxidoreductase [Paludibacterium sp. B53371]